jgi:hypothetical protein
MYWMKLGIMQPYLFPYIGYFQLINAVDRFVIYDNIQFTKKGWINRNRILVNDKEEYFTIPLKKDSDFLNIDKRTVAPGFATEKDKLLRRITASYKKAPYFDKVLPLVEEVINSGEENLFRFVQRSIVAVCDYLDIDTEITVSSAVPIDHELRGQDKVIAICLALNADHYINPPGGISLYSKEAFEQNNIKLDFLQPNAIEYRQFNNEFVPWLSIIDVMMFNSVDEIREKLNAYTLIEHNEK